MARKTKLDVFWLRLKNRLGLITKQEYVDQLLENRSQFLDDLPKEAQFDVEQIERLSNRMMSLEAMRDQDSYWKMSAELAERHQDLVERYGPKKFRNATEKGNYVTGMDSIGYRPSGARVWGFMLSPFQVFTYFAENHWACKSVIDVILTEVTYDGFSLVHDRKVSRKRVREVKDQLDKLDIWELRRTLLKNYLAYGNSIILPHKDPFGNVLKLEPMVMDRVMPIWSKVDYSLLGWDYYVGNITIPYAKNRVLHLANKCLKNPEIGLPPLSPLITDLEADIGAGMLNNTAMYKAGMIGLLISLNEPSDQSPANKNFSKKLQQEIQSSWSGVQAGMSILVSNYVKNVHKLNNLSEFDAAFLKFRNEVAIMVATVFGCPPEKIHKNRSSSLQYAAALVEDTVNAGFDKVMAAYTTILDNFINQKILKELLGIYDIEISANGRNGSLTLNGARAGKIATETGALFSYNELRTMFYGAPPLPSWDDRGWTLGDNSKNRDDKAKEREYAKQDPTSTQADSTNTATKVKVPYDSW